MNAAERDRIDHEITEHLRRGDTASAATSALLAYGVALRDFIFSMLRDETATDEVFAQLNEDLLRALPQFRGECAFRTYAYQLAHNAACRYTKDPFRRRGQRLPTTDLGRVPARSDSTQRRREQLKAGLDRLRETLAPDEQVLLVLRIDQEMAWRDIAHILGDGDPGAEAALRKRFERLKARLRDLAKREGLLRGETR